MTKKVSVQYHAPVDSPVVNERFQDILSTGIYEGGYLSQIPLDNSNVNMSAFVAEISDGTYQARITNDEVEVVSVSSTNNYIVLRWEYTGIGEADFSYTNVSFENIAVTDLIVGRVIYNIGGSITGFDYTLRTVPEILSKHLAVVADSPASMYVFVLPGRVNYGVSNYVVPLQKTSIFTAPVSNPRIDLIYVDTDGTVKISAGTEAATPTAPSYNGKVVLAQVYLTTSMTEITQSDITDVRNFVISSSRLFSWAVSGTVTDGKFVKLVGGVPTWTNIKRNMHFFLDSLSETPNASGMCKACFNGTIVKAYCKVTGNVTGEHMLIDINKNGTSIWNTTQSNRLAVSIGSDFGQQTAFDVTSVTDEDEFTIDIDQYSGGSEKLTVVLTIRED